MPAKINLQIRDNSGETSNLGIYMGDIANALAMQTALDPLTGGVIASRSEVSSISQLSGANPVDQNQQREMALRVFYTDDVTGSLHFISIPSPQLDALTLAGDAVSLADAGIMAAFVTEFELHGVSPAGNAVTVTRAQIVGRAL